MQDKLACSYFNTAVINDKGELYIWGSLNGGLLGPDINFNQVRNHM